MTQDINNINNYIDNSIKSTLLKSTSASFTDRVMGELELSKEFAMQDRKASNLVKIVIAVFSFMILSFSVVLSFYISNKYLSDDANPESAFTNVISFFTGVGTKVVSVLGFSNSIYSFLLIAVVVLIFLIYSFAEKLFFKKGY